MNHQILAVGSTSSGIDIKMNCQMSISQFRNHVLTAEVCKVTVGVPYMGCELK